MSSRLTYAERSHRYALDGEWVPGVTTITGVLDTPALRWWYAQQAALWAANNPDQLGALGFETFVKTATDAPTRAKNAAGGRGTNLHRHAEQLVTTGYTDAPPDQEKLVEHAAEFLDTWDAHPFASEATVYHATFRYAGRLDLIADLADGNRWLLDFKTGKGVYPDMTLQQAAYRYASHYVDADGNDQDMPEVDRAGIVWVRPEGWQLIPLTADRDVWTTFLACIPLLSFARRKADELIGAPLPFPVAS